MAQLPSSVCLLAFLNISRAKPAFKASVHDQPQLSGIFVESQLLCTPSLPLSNSGLWLRREQARAATSRQPSFLLPQDLLGRWEVSKPRT